MAYQPKSYKKFVATAATATMVASAIAPVASAASFSDVADRYKEAVDYIVEQGYAQGYPGGTKFGTNDNIKRQDAAVMVARALGATPDGEYPAAGFTDVPADRQWAVNFLKDKKIIDGKEAGKFGANDFMTRGEMAKVVANAYNLKGNPDNEFPFTDVSATFKEYVDALVEAGVTQGKTATQFATGQNVTRGEFALFVFRAEAPGAEAAVTSVSAVGAKKLEVKFSTAVDTSKAALAVKKGSVNVNVDEIKFADDKKSAVITTTTKLSKGDYTVTLTGVADEASTATTTVADEKVTKINVLTTTAPLNPQPASIGGVSYDVNESAFVNYEVLNQYGEKMSNQSINWTQSTGGHILDVNGKLTIGNTASAGHDFIPGNKVFLTGVHTTSGTVVNAEVTIGLASKADAVEFKGVYNTATKKIEDLPAGFAANKYVLLYEVKDQYGNKISSPDAAELAFTSNNPLFVAQPVDNNNNDDVVIDDVNYEAVPLAPGTNAAAGGTATIQLISKNTGKISTFTVSAEAKSTLKTFTISAPDKIVAETEKVEIPFTAVDQYGNAVTKYSELNGKVSFAENMALEQQADGSAKLYYTAPNNIATANADAPVYLTSLVTNGGNFSSVMLNVKDLAVPTTIVGLDKDVVTKVAKDSTFEIAPADLVVQDQYGRTLSDTKFTNWLGTSTDDTAIVLGTDAATNSPFAVTSSVTTADAAEVILKDKNDVFTVVARNTADLKASERFVFSLSTTNPVAPISTSSKTITFNLSNLSDYTSYEVADLGTVYNDANPTADTAAAYDRTVKVYGVEADGTKVLLPTSRFTVSLNTSKLEVVSGNKISDVATGGYAATDFENLAAGKAYADIPVNVLVTVNDENGAAASIIEKQLLVSNKTPRVASIGVNTDEVENGKAFIKSGAISVSDLRAFIDATEVKDQYGVVLSENPVITITKLVKVDGSALTVSNNGTVNTSITGAAAGDKFTATYKYAGGESVSIDFTVKAN